MDFKKRIKITAIRLYKQYLLHKSPMLHFFGVQFGVADYFMLFWLDVQHIRIWIEFSTLHHTFRRGREQEPLLTQHNQIVTRPSLC